MDKISIMDKESRIKDLEDRIVNIWYDPANCQDVEEILKKNNANIAAFKKQLKILAT